MGGWVGGWVMNEWVGGWEGGRVVGRVGGWVGGWVPHSSLAIHLVSLLCISCRGICEGMQH